MTFLLFLPHTKQSTQFLFPINVFSTGRRKGCCSLLPTAALFRACHPEAEKNEGENLCPCPAAGLQRVSLVTYLVGLQLLVTQLHKRGWSGSLGLCQALLNKKKGKRCLFITGLWDGKVVSIFNRKCSLTNPGSIRSGDLFGSIWALATMLIIFPGPMLHRVETHSVVVYCLERG